MPLKSPLLRRLSPYRTPGLASTRCCFSVGSMRPRAPRARSGKPRAAAAPNAPWKLGAGRCAARAHLHGGPRAPLPPPLRPRLSSARCFAGQLPPGPRWGSPAAAPATPAGPCPPLRPAPSRFIRPLPPRVKRIAARRVQKPAGKREGRPAAKDSLALPPSTPCLVPLGPQEPAARDLGLDDSCAHSPRAPGRIPPRRSRTSVCGKLLRVP